MAVFAAHHDGDLAQLGGKGIDPSIDVASHFGDEWGGVGLAGHAALGGVDFLGEGVGVLGAVGAADPQLRVGDLEGLEGEGVLAIGG